MTKSSSTLAFGALPERKGEIVFSQADTTILVNLGWKPNFDLERGISNTIKEYR